MNDEVKTDVIDAETVETPVNNTQTNTTQPGSTENQNVQPNQAQTNSTQTVPPTQPSSNGTIPPTQGPKVIYVERPRKPFPWKSVIKYACVFAVAGLCGFGGGLLAQHVNGNQSQTFQYPQQNNNGNQYPTFPDFGDDDDIYEYNGNGGSSNNGNTNTNSAGLGISVIERDDGVYIAGFSQDSNAESAGLKINDKIEEIDGKDLDTYNEIVNYLSTKKVGDIVTVTVERNDQDINIQVELSQLSSQSSLPSSGEQSVY